MLDQYKKQARILSKAFLLYYLNKYKKATECILHGTVCPGSSDPPEKNY